MHCPSCQNNDSKVVDSRSSGDGHAIRRRRECLECSFRFSTYEQIELLNLYITKRDGRRQTYSQDKLKSGVYRALEKRPVTEKEVKKMVTEIEREIQSLGVNEISVEQIGEIVMNKLRDIDEVAYIRFASVYRSFKDIESFKEELEKLGNRKA